MVFSKLRCAAVSSHRQLFIGSQDRIVGFKFILLEQLLALTDLDIEQWVAHAEEWVSLRRHREW